MRFSYTARHEYETPIVQPFGPHEIIAKLLFAVISAILLTKYDNCIKTYSFVIGI